MEKKNFTVELPFFCGFYESPFLNSEIEYVENVEFSCKAYEQEVCRKFCKHFLEASPDFVEGVEFVRLTRPYCYNYSADRIYANVELSDGWRENLEFISSKLQKRIREDWTDRDGFWSFLPNDLAKWVLELKKEEPNPEFISYIIAYAMLRKNPDIKWILTEAVLEDVCIEDFVNVETA